MIKGKDMEYLTGINQTVTCRPDGSKYEGTWVDGKQHGNGFHVDKKGNRREGVWENGKRIEWISE